MSDVAVQPAQRTVGVLAATCISTLVVNANTSAVIITSGSLGDVFGRKRIFQLGCCCS